MRGRRSRFRVAALAAVAVVAWVAAGPVPAVEAEESPQVNPDILTPDEEVRAAQIAQANPEVAGYLQSPQPVYLARVELLRLKELEAQRFALVTYYRYEGDLTVQAAVDLGAESVTEVTATPHLPAPVAGEEIEEARRLALEHPEVRSELSPHLPWFEAGAEGYEVQAIGLHTTDPDDPIYGQRVLSVLFETPEGYVAGLEVLANLTAGDVTVTTHEVTP